MHHMYVGPGSIQTTSSHPLHDADTNRKQYTYGRTFTHRRALTGVHLQGCTYTSIASGAVCGESVCMYIHHPHRGRRLVENKHDVVPLSVTVVYEIMHKGMSVSHYISCSKAWHTQTCCTYCIRDYTKEHVTLSLYII